MIRIGSNRARSRSGGGIRIILAIGMAIFAIISYMSSQSTNEVTGENQHISLSKEQEIVLGYQSAPQMEAEFGGEYPDNQVQARIDEIGERLVSQSIAASQGWEFEFTVLDDEQTVNAFALPGGPVYITAGLLEQLSTEDQVAGVLGHEIGHVLARHSAAQMAQSELTNGLIGAVLVASDTNTAATAQMVAQLITMSYGRDDELQSDWLGVCIMDQAGYDPSEMVGVMQVLQAASGGSSMPEFASTHPNPENRIARIEEALNNLDQCPGRG